MVNAFHLNRSPFLGPPTSPYLVLLRPDVNAFRRTPTRTHRGVAAPFFSKFSTASPTPMEIDFPMDLASRKVEISKLSRSLQEFSLPLSLSLIFSRYTRKASWWWCSVHTANKIDLGSSDVRRKKENERWMRRRANEGIGG